MNLSLDEKIAGSYSSPSQKARIFTEGWVLREVYCPNCGNKIVSYENNRPVADFYCSKCSEDFELKSKKGKFGKKVSAGAYHSMIVRINSQEKPHFFFLAYGKDSMNVDNFFIVPKYYFIPGIIEKRRPLAEKAKRVGWIGSNILFSRIPQAGKIFYIEDGIEIKKSDVIKKWQKTAFLKEIKKVEAKGWILDIMNCIDFLNKKEFALQELYSFEDQLSVLYPDNKHVKDKIRQQLQVLRDKGYLEFTAPGEYRLI